MQASLQASARDIALLVVLWAAVTVPFLGKAFHIDDPVHVLQAEHIARHPARPLELEIFWFEWPEWLADSNPVTPPVWPYELAAAISMTGGASEVVLSLLSSLHLLLLVLSVYGLAGWVLTAPFFAAALVLVSPAAVVGRNVMLDIPMLSYLVAGLAAVVVGSERERPGWLALGAILIGVSSVTKLPGAVGVPVALGYILLSRRPRQVPVLVLALVPLCGWYVYQWMATGGIDILRPRGGGGFEPEYSLDTSMAIAGWHPVFWGGTIFAGQAYLVALVTRWAWWPVGLLPLAALGLIGSSPVDLDRAAAPILYGAFLIGGVALAVGAIAGGGRLWRAGGVKRRVGGLLVLWCLGHIGFAVAGLWEMNVRFALLSGITATVLCLAEIESRWAEPPADRRAPRARAAILVIACAVSVLVAWEDSQWANGYRRLVADIARDYPGERIWFVGHWGFQHYATERGFRAYSPRDDEIGRGHLLVVPLNVARQSIPDQVMDHLTVLERRSITPTLPIRTMTGGGGFYGTGWGYMPWGWSRAPADVVVVTRYE